MNDDTTVTEKKSWELIFTVHGEPQSWKRAVPIGRGRVIGKNEGYQTQVKWSAKAAMTNGRVNRSDGPLRLYVIFYFEPPPSWSKTKRAAALANDIACIVRSDLDNFVKNIGDGLNGIAYDDDHQIVDIFAFRRWAEKPRAEVMLSAWTPTEAARIR